MRLLIGITKLHLIFLILVSIIIAVTAIFYSKNDKYEVSDPIAYSVGEGYKMSRSQMVKCVRTDRNTKPGAVYIKNEVVYFEGGSPGLNTTDEMSGIFENNTIWLWIPGNENGDVLNLDTTRNWADTLISGFDGYSYQCEYSDFNEDVFTPPSDVTFNQGN